MNINRDTMSNCFGLVYFETEVERDYLTDILIHSDYLLKEIVYYNSENSQESFLEILTNHENCDTIILPTLEILFNPVCFKNIIDCNFKFICCDNLTDCNILSLLISLHKFEISIGHKATRLALKKIKDEINLTGEYLSTTGHILTNLGRKKGSKGVSTSDAVNKAWKDRIGASSERYNQWILIKDLQSRGNTFSAIVDILNSSGEKSPHGKPWVIGNVSRALNDWWKYFDSNKNVIKFSSKYRIGTDPNQNVIKFTSKDRIGTDPNRHRQWLLINELRDKGNSLLEIVNILNSTGEKTPKGKAWVAGTVSRALSIWGKYFE